ncbi:hypothetical protein DY000_02013199 [Brassica cretica]|uniref:FBD domain-containing protein n=1 Tax=Brassica cretica TaxID=69181 RepID=A0ABQ7D5J9_BRACR|nr:hypothetical protein DY000_02013199 [Brassica cretica]
MILSKRWRTIWTEVPRLEYEDIVSNTNSEQKSVWWFLEKSLQLHKAPILESLCIQLKEICPTNVDVAKLVAQAVDRSLRRLLFHLSWLEKPTSMPNRLYTCETLTELELFNKIILDVPPSVCLPSLAKLFLFCVVYKDDVSLVRLLSNCPVLRILLVIRSEEDGNAKKYTVKVPSLEEFTYLYKRPLSLAENTRFCVDPTTSLSFNLTITPCDSGWLEQLMLMLKSNHELKSLAIKSSYIITQPDHVPKCLASHLEFFKWRSYNDIKEEREFVAFILANSKCLKKAEFVMPNSKNIYDENNICEELKSMFKISPSCQITFTFIHI